ncbi:hypothetical protein C8R43DRAFT_955169 [Mycena crocata]|nr:hypothetical protein C8R43DRAFT_955169 [Mycena crocata]
MSSRPRRAGSDRRPGKIVAPRKRRSALEIQEEEEAAAAAAEEQRQAEEESHLASVRRVAAKEEEMRHRPDLVTASILPPQADADMPVDDGQSSGEQDFGLPPASTIDTDSDGMLLGTDDDLQDEFEADGDDDHDEDYIQDEDDASADVGRVDPHAGDSDAESSDDAGTIQKEFAAFLAARKKGKGDVKGKGKGKEAQKSKAPKATPRGFLRQQILETHDIQAIDTVPGVPASVAIKIKLKRKTVIERAKPAEIGGLRTDWKRRVASSTAGPSQSRSSSKSSTMRTSEPEHGGAFEDDEPEDLVKAVQASKVGHSMSRGNAGTAKMGIKLTPVDPIGPEPTKRKAKPRLSNNDLPFAPQAFRDDLKTYQTGVLAYVLFWAGTRDNVFEAGPSHPDFCSTVEDAWKRFFPGIKINDAVYATAAGAIRNLRSNTGKRALKYVADILYYDIEDADGNIIQSTTANRAEFVKDELKDMSFAYRERTQKRGACRAESILYVFAAYLRAIAIVPEAKKRDHRSSGALALCTAAMERALSMYKTGDLVREKVQRKGKKPSHGFIATPWGDRALKYLVTIKRISAAKWDDAILCANALIDANAPQDWLDPEEDSEGPDPRSNFQLSDDEPEAQNVGPEDE